MVVLYVEDDLEDVTIFSDILALVNLDITFVHSRNGREALDYLEQAVLVPDCIFLDINMPVMNGQELLLTLQRDKRFKNIPVVIYTTSNHASDKDRFLEMGASHFVMKPSTFRQAVDGIGKVLRSLV